MNDIEILEKYIKDKTIKTMGALVTPDKEELQAIENLINRVKELEEIEKEHQKQNGELQERIKQRIAYTKELEKDLFENSSNYVIPKSKIKEKIEEIDNYGDTISFSPPIYKTKKGVEILKEDAELILQELLEE